MLLPTSEIEARTLPIVSLIHVDQPLHGKLRALTSDWFKPASIRRLDDRLRELADESLQRMRDLGGECDFATDIALPFPLQVILKILGLPEEDYPRMSTLIQELFGATDPELGRTLEPGQDRDVVVAEFFDYFSHLTAQRRTAPGDDLASLIANGRIDEAPIGDLETLGYDIIIATAETEILGQEIAKGDWIYLSYKAANLDPKVFDDPLRFDIGRHNADRNISFGYGIHFCLGAQVARNELRRLFGRILPEIETISFAGETATMRTTFVGGHKRVPIRYTLRSPDTPG